MTKDRSVGLATQRPEFFATKLENLLLPVVSTAQGTVALPGSKSISNRVLLLSALAEGRTQLYGLLDSDDTRVMLSALKTLGITLEETADSVTVTGAPRFPTAGAELFMGNAGTAIRPLTAALAVQGRLRTFRGTPHARTAHWRPGRCAADVRRGH